MDFYGRDGQTVDEYIQEANEKKYTIGAIIDLMRDIDDSELLEGTESMKKFSTFVMDKIQDYAHEKYRMKGEIILEGVEDTVDVLLSRYRKTVKEMRDHYRRRAVENDKTYLERKILSSARTKAAIDEMRKFHHLQNASGERIHMDKHSFTGEEEQG